MKTKPNLGSITHLGKQTKVSTREAKSGKIQQGQRQPVSRCLLLWAATSNLSGLGTLTYCSLARPVAAAGCL